MSTITQPRRIDDATRADIAGEVEKARAAILRLIGENADSAWRPRQLIEAAKTEIGARTNTVARIAFWNLIDEGVLKVDEHLIVTVKQK